MRLKHMLLLALVACGASLQAQVFNDAGFESYSVGPGGFLQPASGPWLFSNDAGVVEPPAPNSSTGPLNTWSATFAAVDGQQYASTYAGADTIRQIIGFTAPGDYVISVYAAAPSGAVTIPPAGTFTLGTGEFTFTLGNSAIGDIHALPAGSGWTLFTAPFTVPAPGIYQLGIRNTAASPYFINYDQFNIQPVPEPSVCVLLSAGALAILLHRKRKAQSLINSQ